MAIVNTCNEMFREQLNLIVLQKWKQEGCTNTLKYVILSSGKEVILHSFYHFQMWLCPPSGGKFTLSTTHFLHKNESPCPSGGVLANRLLSLSHALSPVIVAREQADRRHISQPYCPSGDVPLLSHLSSHKERARETNHTGKTSLSTPIFCPILPSSRKIV